MTRYFPASKRKKGASYDLNNMEILAPVKSHQLDSYRNNSNIKTVNYSSESRMQKYMRPLFQR